MASSDPAPTTGSDPAPTTGSDPAPRKGPDPATVQVVPPLPATRRQARERALSLLYEAESKGVGTDQVLAELPVEPDRFAVELVRGVSENAEQVDRLLGRYAREWAVERMPAVDRALLRVAVFELLHRPDVPTAVVISEAVELAQLYSTEDSGRFVNGLLAGIADEVRRPPR